jgi:hypothetical protein
MRIRLGTLRSFIFESLARADTPSAPTDPDATVPGHLPNELPGSAAMDDELGNPIEEEAMVPGRWYGGDEPVGNDRERLGDEAGMDEADERMENDGLGNGVTDPNDPDYDFDISDHLRGDNEKVTLGNPPDETMGEWLSHEIRGYLLQEEPAIAAITADPTDTRGAYTPYDAVKDHTGTDDLSSTWYKSPGREPGTDGDPFRGPDPHAQLGFHPPAAQNDPVASPPAADGEEGVAARRAPPIWQLNGGSDTSKMLGADAHDPASGVGSGDGSEAEEAGEPGESDDEEGAEGEDQG